MVQLILMICHLNVATNRYEGCYLRIYEPSSMDLCYGGMNKEHKLEPGEVVFTRYCHNIGMPIPEAGRFPSPPDAET